MVYSSSLSRARASRGRWLGLVSIFAFMAPVGIAIGLALQEVGRWVLVLAKYLVICKRIGVD